jgi:hypothetical protein
MGGTKIRHQKQDSVRVSVNQAGNRSVVIFSERIQGFTGRHLVFSPHRNHGTAERMTWVHTVEKARIIGRNGQRELPHLGSGSTQLVFRQVEKTAQAIDRSNAIPDLPVPIVPFCGADV